MKLTVTAFVTADGVMQAPGGPDEDRDGGFEHGGWVVPYFGDDLGAFVVEWFALADAFLLGRRTYDIFASHWPKVTDPNDPVASALNALPKYVVSRSARSAEWNRSSVIGADDIAALKQKPGRELQVHGSPGLIQTLIERDLIDEYRIWTFPVALGKGKRLFGSGTAPRALELLDTRRSQSGVVINCYRSAGKPTFGSFALDQ